MSVKLPADFAKAISESLAVTPLAVAELFEIEEDKQGFFVAKLKPKQFLDKMQFRTLCTLVRDLGGEDYLEGTKAWKVPGPFAKKDAEKPSGQGMDSERAYKEPGNAIPTGPSGVVPRVVADDKSRPPEFGPLPVKLGYYEKFSIQYIISPKFTFRMHIESDIQELIGQISTTQAGDELCIIAEPLICRPASKFGYIEVGAGERRLLAARKMGLGVVPVIIKKFTDEEFDRIRMMENLARKDLTDYEVARALKYLMDTYPKIYPTQANIADIFGKSREWVTQRLQMLRLENDNVTRVTMESGEMTERQAREILAAPEEKREEIMDSIKETGKVPSARELEQMRKPSIPCARCGDPIEGPPVHFEGKFYCQECYEQLEAEKVPGLLPEPARAGEPEEEEKQEPTKQKPTKPQPVDFAEVTCPVCNETFRLVHHGHHDHRPEYYREV